ncbi:hypothetical protein BDB00DRAFT_409430 [Zychaea mexicana]|uniref:uncharacterized protein n=1 Tax=Zychaea mexicana TaxID=64656 RepID=UPI0022FEB319|nr:uncharacterized protein BDB00DRAFT_409430 [Zychaea mexicana]KAI9492963.1 hypothetical protein BDB00DRAFT_409430 [Zychaea mexicana]
MMLPDAWCILLLCITTFIRTKLFPGQSTANSDVAFEDTDAKVQNVGRSRFQTSTAVTDSSISSLSINCFCLVIKST